MAVDQMVDSVAVVALDVGLAAGLAARRAVDWVEEKGCT